MKLTEKMKKSISRLKKKYPEFIELQDGQILYILKAYKEMSRNDF